MRSTTGYQPPPAYPEHASNILEQAIISGMLEPGQRVTEAELSQMLGVSRTPVREATRILEARGLIIRKPNRGTYIASRTTQQEAEALYRLRIPLEAYLAGRAAESANGDTHEKLRGLQSEFRETLAGVGPDAPDELIRLDSEFHWTIYRAADSDLVSVVGSYWARLQRELSARTYSAERPEYFADQHDQIVTALIGGDAERSAQLMAEHIEASWLAVAASYDQRGKSEPSADG
jgi:DNA-binding GntR family transcriptional regulator